MRILPRTSLLMSCSPVVSDEWGSQIQSFDASISDIVGLCADLSMGAFNPERFLPSIPPPMPPVHPDESGESEIPVRRRIVSYKSNRSASTNSSGTHRARSLINSRTRSSIQSSLMAMQEEHNGKGTKRPISPEDMGQSDFKRRTLRQASWGSQHTDGSNIQPEECTSTEVQEPPITHVPDAIPEVPEPADETQTSQFNPNETLDLPNPFAAQEEAPPVPQIPESALKTEEEEVEAATETQTEQAEAVPQPITREKTLPTIPTNVSEPAALGNAPEASANATSAKAPTETDDQPVPDEAGVQSEPTAGDEKSSMPAAFSMVGLVKKSMRKEKSVRFRELNTDAPPVPPLPLTAESMRQIAPRPPKPLTAETETSDVVEAPTRRIKGKSAISEDQLQQFRLPEMTMEEHEPAEDANETLNLGPVDNISSAMRASITTLNDKISRLRRYRPSVQNGQWTEDWIQFKNAAKALNSRWTQMERAYENNQMHLASLQLSHDQPDDRVHLAQAEHARLQDEANMVLPLRIQIEQLSKRCDSLAELEEDARLENAEVYNVRKLLTRCSMRSLRSCTSPVSDQRMKKLIFCGRNWSKQLPNSTPCVLRAGVW